LIPNENRVVEEAKSLFHAIVDEGVSRVSMKIQTVSSFSAPVTGVF
jgi:hypothetical protein